MRTQPLVSICIPTYNGADFIAQAMDSVLAQTYANLEIVVSDDSSKDNTLKIIESYKSKTNLPIHIVDHEPKGIGANWNNCIRLAQGQYIKFLFQDDILLPECVEKMVEVLENYPNISLVAVKRNLIFEESVLKEERSRWIDVYGDLQKSLNLRSNGHGISFLDRGLFKSFRFFNAPLNKIGEPTTVLIRKNIFNKVGIFREDLKQILDYEFYYRVLKHQNILILNEKQVKFRIHANQASFINNTSVMDEDQVYFRNEIYKQFPLQLPKKKLYSYYFNKFRK
ncbi:glycosyltransferase [Mangrovimonas sp. YM274]|uniref:glycosyltransferase family 2 protein n=1 Tax=Mangrovimonas sp. YM274 TaxID=3070660 RepID=UPI0027DACCD0|nr:glycosyltransferase [Mangrovimonas sp. YM274]WMI69841.1 glycosyltransferase [Mangrovimonas sp. YM274]